MKKIKNLEMIVEIPQGSSNKYEYDELTKIWKLDRVLSGAMFYPGEYGFISETLDYDGDPLDVICLTNHPTFPSCYLPIRIIGVLKMIDGGEEDDKLLAVNAVESRLNNLNNLEDINKNKLDEISNFFLRYKELENKKVIIHGFKGKIEAKKVLVNCQKLYQKNKHLLVKEIEKKELVKKLQLEKSK